MAEYKPCSICGTQIDYRYYGEEEPTCYDCINKRPKPMEIAGIKLLDKEGKTIAYRTFNPIRLENMDKITITWKIFSPDMIAISKMLHDVTDRGTTGVYEEESET